ncbi:hypothetical protein T439DRAFT_324160 [Meredithblackwellia eburnea MCA 4105]
MGFRSPFAQFGAGGPGAGVRQFGGGMVLRFGPEGASFVRLGPDGQPQEDPQQQQQRAGDGAQPAQQQQPMNPFSAILQALGLAVSPQAEGGPAQRAGPAPAAAGGGPQRDEGDDDGRVPINNLASFLGEAFQAPHPADDPDNNPFAEGGHERNTEEELGGAPPPHHQPQQPLNYLFNLLQSLAGGPGVGRANVGDFAWGEAGFQQILNDLMEQASGRAGPQPATPEIIEALPHLKVTQEILDLDTIKDCPICREDYVVDDDLLSLPCRHAFHPDCIKQWLGTSGTCPVWYVTNASFLCPSRSLSLLSDLQS